MAKEKKVKEPKKVKDMNVFDYITSIGIKKKIEDFNKKECSRYMLALAFNNSSQTCGIANEINRMLYDIDDRLVYEYFFDKIPKGRTFMKWPKKNKTGFEEEVKEFAEKHEMSISEAECLLLL